MIYDFLLQFIPPPLSPVPYEADELEAIVAAQGPLPSDYLRLIGDYGSGSWDEFLWIYVPRREPPALSLRKQIPRQSSAFGQTAGARGQIKFWPSPGGLLPLGITDNGDLIAWKTVGEPDRWTIALEEARGAVYEEHPVNLVTFLLDVLTKNLRSNVFPEDFPDDNPVFTPVPVR